MIEWLSTEVDRLNAAEPGRDANVSDVVRMRIVRAMLESQTAASIPKGAARSPKVSRKS